MKKTFLILVILTMVCSVFAKGSSEKQEKGTYIPLAILSKTFKHYLRFYEAKKRASP